MTRHPGGIALQLVELQYGKARAARCAGCVISERDNGASRQLPQRPIVSDMPQLEATFQGTPYSIDIAHHPDGWTWSCVVDGLLKGKSMSVLDSEAGAQAAAHAEAHTLIADFFSAK